jgi:type VI secretion system protein ImpK
MTDPFAGLVYPVFQEVIEVLQALDEGANPPLESARGRIVGALEEAGRKAASSATLTHDFELARHALIYWADEVLINSPWAHALEWKNRILEWEYYQSRERADRFFELAHDAERLAGTDPLETFYLCVALGFRGRFADDPAGLRKWSDRVYNRVAAGLQQPERFLPDEATDHEALWPLPGPSRLLAVSVLVALSAVVTVACFVAAVPPWE